MTGPGSTRTMAVKVGSRPGGAPRLRSGVSGSGASESRRCATPLLARSIDDEGRRSATDRRPSRRSTAAARSPAVLASLSRGRDGSGPRGGTRRTRGAGGGDALRPRRSRGRTAPGDSSRSSAPRFRSARATGRLCALVSRRRPSPHRRLPRRTETSKPSRPSSPWILEAPQPFSSAILRMRSRTSAATGGRPVRRPRRDSQFQVRPGNAGRKGVRSCGDNTKFRIVVQRVRIPPGQSRARQVGSEPCAVARVTGSAMRRCARKRAVRISLEKDGVRDAEGVWNPEGGGAPGESGRVGGTSRGVMEHGARQEDDPGDLGGPRSSSEGIRDRGDPVNDPRRAARPRTQAPPVKNKRPHRGRPKARDDHSRGRWERGSRRTAYERRRRVTAGQPKPAEQRRFVSG